MAIEPSNVCKTCPSYLVVKKMSNIITIRVPTSLAFVISGNRALPERILPFLPPGFSEASPIWASLSMRPALRNALAAKDFALDAGTGAGVEKRDIFAPVETQVGDNSALKG